MTSGLATRCPACGTVFRVVPDQLRVSEGWVRCGRCSEVFDASQSLTDIETGEPAPAQSPAGARRRRSRCRSRASRRCPRRLPRLRRRHLPRRRHRIGPTHHRRRPGAAPSSEPSRPATMTKVRRLSSSHPRSTGP
ncbi:hypothetical protein RA210_U90150 [Rubrivivax sp. A210]|nr:hypothetical protein RA210_U90150 [Rubrivivax sp. A210]